MKCCSWPFVRRRMACECLLFAADDGDDHSISVPCTSMHMHMQCLESACDCRWPFDAHTDPRFEITPMEMGAYLDGRKKHKHRPQPVVLGNISACMLVVIPKEGTFELLDAGLTNGFDSSFWDYDRCVCNSGEEWSYNGFGHPNVLQMTK